MGFAMWNIQGLSATAALSAILALAAALGSLTLGLGIVALLAAPALGLLSLASGIGAAAMALREAR
jgi:hypothetical protein